MKPIHYPNGTLSLVNRLQPTRLDAIDPYVERFWTPIIGPASIAVLRWANRERPVSMPIAAIGECVGLTSNHGKNSPIWRTLNRMMMFGLAELIDIEHGHVAVWSKVPYLTKMRLSKLPEHLRNAEQTYWNDRLAASNGEAPPFKMASHRIG